MMAAMHSNSLIYSVLSNGNYVEGMLPLGTRVTTQWGPRLVVEHVAVSAASNDHITAGEIASGTQ